MPFPPMDGAIQKWMLWASESKKGKIPQRERCDAACTWDLG